MKIILNNNGIKKREIRQMAWWHTRAKVFLGIAVVELLVILALSFYIFNKYL